MFSGAFDDSIGIVRQGIALKLFTQRVAPNPTKLELYLAEKAALGCVIPFERVSVSLIKGKHRSAAFGMSAIARAMK